MNSQKIIYLSKKGLKGLRKDLANRERDRQAAITALSELERTDGRDERLERSERLAQIEILDNEIADIKLTLANAKLFPRKRDVLKVAIGSVVELLDAKGRIIRYTIVDSIEANPSEGRISIKSPLGRSLLGKQIQDVVEWSVGTRTNRWQLVAIA